MYCEGSASLLLKIYSLIISITFCVVQIPVSAMEKGCKKITTPQSDLLCKCGYRENASYPPKYSEYLQQGTDWEYVSMFNGLKDGDPYLKNGKKCEFEFYLFNEAESNKKNEKLQSL